MNGPDITRASRRLSRETRNLLIAACVSLLALWLLARLRFPDRPSPVNPISPVLTQLSAPPVFAELASEVVRVRTRLGDALVAVDDDAPVGAAGRGVRAALRIRPDAAVMLSPGAPSGPAAGQLLAFDPASALAVVRVGSVTALPSVVPWTPARLEAPRFVMMTTASKAGVWLQPLFLSALSAATTPAWSGPIWLVPRGTDLPAGALLFSVEGELVGLSVVEDDRTAIVPGDVLLADAQRLQARGTAVAGGLGVTVQTLDARVAAATGAGQGVVVTWVAPEGPAAGSLRPGDVIEALNGNALSTKRDWEVRSQRLSAGEAVAIDVRRGGTVTQIDMTAVADPPPQRRSLGLTLRVVANVGSEVLRVDPGSAAEAAGIHSGDIITLIGDTARPTPARIRQAFDDTDDMSPVLAAFARGDAHHVTALDK